MKMFATIALLAALATLTGCGDLQQPSAKIAAISKPQKTQNRGTAHRFALTKFNAGVAFDTQTGQICKSWDWEASGPLRKPDLVTGGIPKRTFGESSPTCLSFYREYPSTGQSSTGRMKCLTVWRLILKNRDAYDITAKRALDEMEGREKHFI